MGPKEFFCKYEGLNGHRQVTVDNVLEVSGPIKQCNFFDITADCGNDCVNVRFTPEQFQEFIEHCQWVSNKEWQNG